ncbi:unnamed protein product [Protopolystoma xenopodis]|uniref:Uncharacterized protein n=1 Tax=Protopolystoma xenopodis TaxID=117903 RepID=A0A3S4ZU08_9PLAT|nr:unnamed protein product [Protopolystoma xenopodis]
MAPLTDDAGETFGNVPSQWSNAGNHKYYGSGNRTRYVPQGLTDAATNDVFLPDETTVYQHRSDVSPRPEDGEELHSSQELDDISKNAPSPPAVMEWGKSYDEKAQPLTGINKEQIISMGENKDYSTVMSKPGEIIESYDTDMAYTQSNISTVPVPDKQSDSRVDYNKENKENFKEIMQEILQTSPCDEGKQNEPSLLGAEQNNASVKIRKRQKKVYSTEIDADLDKDVNLNEEHLVVLAVNNQSNDEDEEEDEEMYAEDELFCCEDDGEDSEKKKKKKKRKEAKRKKGEKAVSSLLEIMERYPGGRTDMEGIVNTTDQPDSKPHILHLTAASSLLEIMERYPGGRTDMEGIVNTTDQPDSKPHILHLTAASTSKYLDYRQDLQSHLLWQMCTWTSCKKN